MSLSKAGHEPPSGLPEAISHWYCIGPYHMTLKDVTCFTKILTELHESFGDDCCRAFEANGHYILIDPAKTDVMLAAGRLMNAEAADDLVDNLDMEHMLDTLIDKEWNRMDLQERIDLCNIHKLPWSNVIEAQVPDDVYGVLNYSLRNVMEYNDWKFQNRKRPRL
jgi:hypothetical protein